MNFSSLPARIWGETWTLDNLGHFALWLIACALVEWPLWISGGAFDLNWPALPGPIAATLCTLFLRELTQVQATKFDHDFTEGWPWDEYQNGRPVWSLHKHMEWIAPSAGGLAVKGAMIGVL